MKPMKMKGVASKNELKRNGHIFVWAMSSLTCIIPIIALTVSTATHNINIVSIAITIIIIMSTIMLAIAIVAPVIIIGRGWR